VIKPLNMFSNIVSFAPATGEAIGPSSFQARLPRVAFGLLGASLAAATIAVSVVLPAQLDAAGSEPQMHLASQGIPVASNAAAITSITVVAAREPRASTRPLRVAEAVTSPAPSGETTASPILRISTAAR
jgi:hypothetical protein